MVKRCLSVRDISRLARIEPRLAPVIYSALILMRRALAQSQMETRSSRSARLEGEGGPDRGASTLRDASVGARHASPLQTLLRMRLEGVALFRAISHWADPARDSLWRRPPLQVPAMPPARPTTWEAVPEGQPMPPANSHARLPRPAVAASSSPASSPAVRAVPP